jgi:uncharacterized protein (UPF0276 family)
MRDRFGLGWRPELAAGILCNLDRIDVLEVMADDYVDAPRSAIRALRTLSAQVPLTLHALSLGLASSVPVEEKRLEKVARLVGELEPEGWSEHLAFVRGGGYEIGHLAAPPRNDATIEGAAGNLRIARRRVGAPPSVENIASLIDPPASRYDESTWIARILSLADVDLLLDLHNVYTNALNFGFDPIGFLTRIPAERISTIHIAGGKWISAAGDDGQTGTRRRLDDHLHDVPEPVFDLLREVGARVTRPLTVILERDGQYPPIEQLLAQLDAARAALQQGRASRRDCLEETHV